MNYHFSIPTKGSEDTQQMVRLFFYMGWNFLKLYWKMILLLNAPVNENILYSASIAPVKQGRLNRFVQANKSWFELSEKHSLSRRKDKFMSLYWRDLLKWPWIVNVWNQQFVYSCWIIVFSSGWAGWQSGENASEHPGRSQLYSATTSSSIPPIPTSTSSRDAFLFPQWLLPPPAPYNASSEEGQRDAWWVQPLTVTGHFLVFGLLFWCQK